MLKIEHKGGRMGVKIVMTAQQNYVMFCTCIYACKCKYICLSCFDLCLGRRVFDSSRL